MLSEVSNFMFVSFPLLSSITYWCWIFADHAMSSRVGLPLPQAVILPHWQSQQSLGIWYILWMSIIVVWIYQWTGTTRSSDASFRYFWGVIHRCSCSPPSQLWSGNVYLFKASCIKGWAIVSVHAHMPHPSFVGFSESAQKQRKFVCILREPPFLWTDFIVNCSLHHRLQFPPACQVCLLLIHFICWRIFFIGLSLVLGTVTLPTYTVQKYKLFKVSPWSCLYLFK